MNWRGCLRHNARRDQAEGPIIEALRRCGCSVERLSKKDVPDLLVGYQGENHLLEIKSDAKISHKKGTGASDGQLQWACDWRGKKPRLVRTIDEALRAIGAMR